MLIPLRLCACSCLCRTCRICVKVVTPFEVYLIHDQFLTRKALTCQKKAYKLYTDLKLQRSRFFLQAPWLRSHSWLWLLLHVHCNTHVCHHYIGCSTFHWHALLVHMCFLCRTLEGALDLKKVCVSGHENADCVSQCKCLLLHYNE